MISVLINSTKYDIYKYKINNSRHLNFYVKAIKQFFLHKQEYISKYIIDNFKISAKAILYKELNRIKQTFSINAISKPEKLLKYKKIKSFLKLINNKTIYKFYPENFTYNLIICLDNTETINETIDTEKIKNTIFNDIKNSKNNSQYFNQYFKNTLTNTDTYISKNNIQNEDTITYIYVNLKITKNIYINLVSFYYINKTANTINPDKFSNAINNLIAESKLYSLLNYPNIPETKLISKISKLPADSSFYSITDYSLIKHNSDDLLHTNTLNYLDEYKYNVTDINVYCTDDSD